MVKKSIFLISVGLLCFSALMARCQKVGQCPEFDKFVQHYGLVNAGKLGQRILDCQSNPECAKALNQFQYDHNGMIRELPGIWIKGALANCALDIPRAINARRLQNCIARHNLYLLGVASKCIGQVNGQWRVFAQHINSSSFSVSLELIQQLVLLAEETGYRDWNNNWIWDSSQRKLICIDTEDNSFIVGKYRGIEGRNDIPNHCIFNYVVSLCIWEDYMVPEAQQWFYKQLYKLSKSPKALAQVTPIDYPLAWNTKYDDPAEGIDFQKVKAEYTRG